MTAEPRYIEDAVESRSRDYGVVRDWLFHQLDYYLPAIAKDLACILSADDADVGDAATTWCTSMREKLASDLAADPRTQTLAAELAQAEADEEAEWLADCAREDALEMES